jgi:hypothetical protein
MTQLCNVSEFTRKQGYVPSVMEASVPYVGLGNDVWQVQIAFPQSRGQVISFSKKLLICLKKGATASNGCRREKEIASAEQQAIIGGKHQSKEREGRHVDRSSSNHIREEKIESLRDTGTK